MTQTEVTPTARGLRLTSRFLKRSWQGILVGTLAFGIGVAAYASPGLIEADVQLDHGNVYAVKRDSDRVGTINAQIDEVTGAVSSGDSTVELLQEDDVVLAHLPQSDQLTFYNPGRDALGNLNQLPSNAFLQLVGGNLLVFNPVNGRAWFGEAATVAEYDFQKEKADLELSENAAVTLTVDGDIIGLDPARSALVRLGEEGLVSTPLPFELSTAQLNVELSAVGDKAVVLDRISQRIWVEGMSEAFDVSGASSAQLLPPVASVLGGREGLRAVYATSAGLIGVSSDGTRRVAGDRQATPVAPVQVGDCIYGAFVGGGEGQFVKACAGQEPRIEEIPQITSDGTELTFQVNRTTVGLNDQANGTVWLVDKNMTVVPPEAWEPFLKSQEPEQTTEPDNNPDNQPERQEENRDPIANDDSLAARAGRSTILTVLDNDTDPDGDVLTIRSLTSEVPGARLEPVRDGAGLQITVDPETKGTLAFTYEVADGRGGTDTAQVTVRVLSGDTTVENTAPRKFEHAQDLTVELGQAGVTKRVLLDWRDPDGDPLMLKDADMDPSHDDIVNFTPDGTLTYTDIGKTTGRKTIRIVVSDGVADTEGELVVNVVEEEVAPIAYGDFVTTAVGEAVTIEPLLNDVGANLTLSEFRVLECTSECVTEERYRDKAFTFKAARAGVYYATYTVTNGQAATGTIRIDVRAPGAAHAPVAALDVALLPPGGSVIVDPLLNDTDADGDVLVIQTYSHSPALEVVMERRHLMTIRAVHTPEAPVDIQYRVSDGKTSVVGTIVVIPTESGGLLNPRAVPDTLSVRSGATGAVDVLQNDTSPVGLDLELAELTDNPFGERAWIEGNRVRVAVPAGTAAGTSTIAYVVRDSEGNQSAGRLTVTVVSEDADNEAPRPRQVIDRVLAGTTTRIPVNIDGVDPNGDAVRLIGLGSGPRLGRVTEIGEEYFTYEAYPTSEGTDNFYYALVDSYGRHATGSVRIGVAPPTKLNSPPVGVMDEITVRPGRQVQLAALANDFDVDGDSIGYSSDSPAVMSDKGIEVTLLDDRELVLTAPDKVGDYLGRYDITDARGETAYGNLRVIVEEDAPLLAPVTRNDIVPMASLIGKEWVDIDAMANDYDPDGPRDQLTLRVPDYGAPEEQAARVSEDGTKVIVRILDRMQQIRYELVDSDDNVTNGIVTVPGLQDAVPVLRDQNLEITATAGQPVTIGLNDIVVGTGGREVRLTDADNVTATHGAAKPTGEDTVEYRPDETYQGPASVVFEVVDRAKDEKDDTARSAFISLKVKVLRPKIDGGNPNGTETTVFQNLPPERLSEEPTLRVGQGEEEGRLDLLALFRDPDGDSIFIDGGLRVTGGGGGIDHRLEGNHLIASAPLSTQPGATVELSGTVRDAADNTTPFTVRVLVIPSSAPLTSTGDDVVDTAAAGVALPLFPLSNDKSFVMRDTSLRITAVRKLGGEGSISLNESTGEVTVVPAAGWHGALTASYTVMDSTNDPNRQVEGKIRVQVKDKPGRPSAPYSASAGDGEVSFTYDSTGDGGAEITTRVATATSPGQDPVTANCGIGYCRVTGLRNGVLWTFTVQEGNIIGMSDQSPTSGAVKPDARPAAPTGPTLTSADRALLLNWTHNPQYHSRFGGSPIRDYLVTLYDDAGNVLAADTSVRPNDLPYRWEGLENGKRYMFSVKARNINDDIAPSDASPMSPVEYPAGKPIGSIPVTATVIESEAGGGFSVSFDRSAINPNGDPVSMYTIMPVVQGGGELPALSRQVAASTLSGNTVETTMLGLGTNRTKFVVKATNRAGEAIVGDSGDFKVAWALPAFETVDVVAGDGSFTVTGTLKQATAPAVLEYNTGGGWNAVPASGVVGGRTNGQQLTVRVRARVEAMTSAEFSKSVTPRSTIPPTPQIESGSLRLKASGDVFTVTADLDTTGMLATQGWTPNDYIYCVVRDSSNCKKDAHWSRQSTVALAFGSNSMWWRHLDYQNGLNIQTTLNVSGSTEVVYSHPALRLKLPYVSSGGCTVTMEGQTLAIPITSGGLYFDSALSVTVPEGPEGASITRPPNDATLSCEINGTTYTKKLK